MVHSTYDSVQLVKSCPSKIETNASYGSKLFVGCSDCSIRVFSPRSSGDDPASDEIQREEYSEERRIPNLWRRAPLAMEVCASRDLLLSLFEWVALHRLPGLETVVAVAKTKGANVYMWNDRRGFLCIGRQKRVGIYRLDSQF